MYNILVFYLGSQHNDRNTTSLQSSFQLAATIESILYRHHYITKNQIRKFFHSHVNPFLSIGSHQQVILFSKHNFQIETNILVILNNQQGLFKSCRSRWNKFLNCPVRLRKVQQLGFYLTCIFRFNKQNIRIIFEHTFIQWKTYNNLCTSIMRTLQTDFSMMYFNNLTYCRKAHFRIDQFLFRYFIFINQFFGGPYHSLSFIFNNSRHIMQLFLYCFRNGQRNIP